MRKLQFSLEGREKKRYEFIGRRKLFLKTARAIPVIYSQLFQFLFSYSILKAIELGFLTVTQSTFVIVCNSGGMSFLQSFRFSKETRENCSFPQTFICNASDQNLQNNQPHIKNTSSCAGLSLSPKRIPRNL